MKATKTVYAGPCTLYGKKTHKDSLEMSQDHFLRVSVI